MKEREREFSCVAVLSGRTTRAAQQALPVKGYAYVTHTIDISLRYLIFYQYRSNDGTCLREGALSFLLYVDSPPAREHML